MIYYWLQDDLSNTLALDTSVIKIDLPALTRDISAVNTFSDSAIIQGSGSWVPGQITISKNFKKQGAGTPWNSVSYAFKQWVGIGRVNNLWFYISDGTLTMKALVVPFSKSVETMTSFAITNAVSFVLQMVKGFWENTTASSTVTNLTSIPQTIPITNNGLMEVSPILQIVPTADFTLFQVQLSTNYGVRLEGAFLSGHTFIYDCRTGVFTDNGIDITYNRTAGSVFKLTPGINYLKVWAQGTGGSPAPFTVSFYERYF